MHDVFLQEISTTVAHTITKGQMVGTPGQIKAERIGVVLDNMISELGDLINFYRMCVGSNFSLDAK